MAEFPIEVGAMWWRTGELLGDGDGMGCGELGSVWLRVKPVSRQRRSARMARASSTISLWSNTRAGTESTGSHRTDS